LGTVRDWEQGRRAPDTASRNLLKIIDREPEAAARALEGV
jgi:putative transcriptional regulator